MGPRTAAMRHAARAITCAIVLAAGLAACTTQPGGGLDGVDCRADVVGPLSALADDGFSGAVVMSAPGFACAAGFGAAGEDGLPVTTDTVFSIGSVTKTATAAAVLSLAADGRLRLDDPVGRWLPGLPADVRAVTIEELMRHTGGLGSAHGADDEPMSRNDALRGIGERGLLAEPGARYGYSNSGYTLLAAVVEEVTGSTYRDVVLDQVLAPGAAGAEEVPGFWTGDRQAGGHRATGYADDGSVIGTGGASGEFWALEGNGGLALSGQGLHDWVRALVSGEVVSGRELDLMTAVPDGADPSQPEDPGAPVGFVAADDGDGGVALATAGGGGTGHIVVAVWVPDADLVVVVATNRPEITAEDLARPLVEAVLAGEPVPVPVAGVDVDPAVVASLTGRYALPDGSTVTLLPDGDDALAARPSGGAALAALYPPPPGAPDLAEHQDAAVEFLAGGTPAGREELALLAGELGPVTGSEILGSGFTDGAPRTWVRVTGERAEVTGWVELDANGELSAVDYGGPPPAQRLVLTDDGRWVPATGAGRGGEVAVAVVDGIMSLVAPGGTVTARVRATDR